MSRQYDWINAIAPERTLNGLVIHIVVRWDRSVTSKEFNPAASRRYRHDSPRGRTTKAFTINCSTQARPASRTLRSAEDPADVVGCYSRCYPTQDKGRNPIEKCGDPGRI